MEVEGESPGHEDRLLLATDSETGAVREDALFFGHFTVPSQHWVAGDRVQDTGYIYFHRETDRPIFVFRTLMEYVDEGDDDDKSETRIELCGYGINWQSRPESDNVDKWETSVDGAEESVPGALEDIHAVYCKLGQFVSEEQRSHCLVVFEEANGFHVIPSTLAAKPRKRVKTKYGRNRK